MYRNSIYFYSQPKPVPRIIVSGNGAHWEFTGNEYDDRSNLTMNGYSITFNVNKTHMQGSDYQYKYIIEIEGEDAHPTEDFIFKVPGYNPPENYEYLTKPNWLYAFDTQEELDYPFLPTIVYTKTLNYDEQIEEEYAYDSNGNQITVVYESPSQPWSAEIKNVYDDPIEEVVVEYTQRPGA